jgi:hypothetical protein
MRPPPDPSFRLAEDFRRGASAVAFVDLFDGALFDGALFDGDFLAVDVRFDDERLADDVEAADRFLADRFAGDFFAGDLLAGDFEAAFFEVVLFSAMTLLSHLLADDESLDQLVLAGGRLFLVQLAGGPQGIDLLQLRADRRRVVELVLGLPAHLLGDRHHAPQRRHRRREQTGQQAHQPSPTKS